MSRSTSKKTSITT